MRKASITYASGIELNRIVNHVLLSFHHRAQLSLKTTDKLERQIVLRLLSLPGQLLGRLFQVLFCLIDIAARGRPLLAAVLATSVFRRLTKPIRRALGTFAGIGGLQTLQLTGQLFNLRPQRLLGTGQLAELVRRGCTRRLTFRLGNLLPQRGQLFAKLC